MKTTFIVGSFIDARVRDDAIRNIEVERVNVLAEALTGEQDYHGIDGGDVLRVIQSQFDDLGLTRDSAVIDTACYDAGLSVRLGSTRAIAIKALRELADQLEKQYV